ncbi:cytochrome c [Salibacteraceae bacterium]|nr:cytochrome c [Salibacteraceae bacterium]
MLITISSCEHEPFEPIIEDVIVDATTTQDSTTIPSFSLEIQPIIDANCATSGCHASGAQFPPLTNYTEIKDRSDRVKATTGSGSMPKVGSLTTAQIETIANWVDGGAPNN